MKNKNDIIVRTAGTPQGVHIREIEGEQESRIIAGYAILFNVESEPLWSDEDSEAREVIDPNAITRELLDKCDIKFTMYHNRQIILARSNKGKGTLSYNVDSKGVSFEFEAPDTEDGDTAIELVKRGDIDGCSFAFCTKYWNSAFVSRDVHIIDDRSIITYRVNVITDIMDFTLTPDPAYSDTTCETRELFKELRENKKEDESEDKEDKESEEKIKKQISDMRDNANKSINI